MKFLIVGDLHGNKPKIYYKDFDVIIAPGDFCSDTGFREILHKAYKSFLEDPQHRKEWWEIVGKRKARKMLKRSVSSGRKILEYLNSFDVPVYIIPGNWDWASIWKAEWDFINQNFFKKFLIKNLKNIVNVDEKIKNLGKYQIIGYGECNGPELYKYRDYKGLKKKDIQRNKRNYNTLLRGYNHLFKKAKKPVIFLSHNVPFNTPLDKITDKKSLRYGYHYGSLVAREMIDKYQPLVCIGGHMHEHFGKCKIGKTTVINSGFGSKVNVFLEIENNKIKKLEFYKGKK